MVSACQYVFLIHNGFFTILKLANGLALQYLLPPINFIVSQILIALQSSVFANVKSTGGKSGTCASNCKAVVPATLILGLVTGNVYMFTDW